MTPQHLGITPEALEALPKRALYYQAVWASPSYTIGVFILGDGATIPLHNHPGMVVLSHIVAGDVSWSAYDWLPRYCSTSAPRGR